MITRPSSLGYLNFWYRKLSPKRAIPSPDSFLGSRIKSSSEPVDLSMSANGLVSYPKNSGTSWSRPSKTACHARRSAFRPIASKRVCSQVIVTNVASERLVMCRPSWPTSLFVQSCSFFKLLCVSVRTRKCPSSSQTWSLPFGRGNILPIWCCARVIASVSCV